MTSATSHQRSTSQRGTLGKWVKEHGLMLANVGLFLAFFGGMILTGAADYSVQSATLGNVIIHVWGRPGFPFSTVMRAAMRTR